MTTDDLDEYGRCPAHKISDTPGCLSCDHEAVHRQQRIDAKQVEDALAEELWRTVSKAIQSAGVAK